MLHGKSVNAGKVLKDKIWRETVCASYTFIEVYILCNIIICIYKFIMSFCAFPVWQQPLCAIP